MDKFLQNAGELPASARSAVEGLVGHPLRDDQPVYIVALDTSTDPPLEERRQAWAELQGIMDNVHTQVRQSGVSADELERTIDEACNEVRYGK